MSNTPHAIIKAANIQATNLIELGYSINKDAMPQIINNTFDGIRLINRFIVNSLPFVAYSQ